MMYPEHKPMEQNSQYRNSPRPVEIQAHRPAIALALTRGFLSYRFPSILYLPFLSLYNKKRPPPKGSRCRINAINYLICK